jgi:hypothetical protein
MFKKLEEIQGQKIDISDIDNLPSGEEGCKLPKRSPIALVANASIIVTA